MSAASFRVVRRGRVLSAATLVLACGFVFAVASAAEKTSVQPKYGTHAVRLFHARDYLRENEAPDFWAIMPYYVHQFSERACSVASATMVVNAARAQAELSAADELITQGMMMRRVAYPRWHDAIQEGGDGVTIEDLGGYLTEALRRFSPDEYEVDAVRVKPNDPGLRERVRKMLIENEASDDDFVLVFFWQATFTDDPEGKTGHVAPLAAYDEENDRALVFDPDRDWYEPYWVPLDTLVAGMARTDPETGRPRGYIWVRKRP
jgi:hypothetical protein